MEPGLHLSASRYLNLVRCSWPERTLSTGRASISSKLRSISSSLTISPRTDINTWEPCILRVACFCRPA